MANDQEDAAKAAGDALERALMKATQSVERELARIVRTGEEDLDRLGRKIAETLAQLACWAGLAAVRRLKRQRMVGGCRRSTRSRRRWPRRRGAGRVSHECVS